MDGKRSAEFIRAIYKKNISLAIGNKKAKDVTTDDAADIIADVAQRGALVLANRVRSSSIAAFNFGAKVRNLPRWRRKAPVFDLTGNPFAGTEKAIKREMRGQCHLSSDELRQFWFALGENFEVPGGHGSKRMVALDAFTQISLKLLIGTGQRVDEVLHAEWSEFDTEELLWTIPASRRKNASKNISGEPHIVPLTKFHLKLLDELRQFFEGGKYLFPTKTDNRPRDHRSLSQAVTRLCARTDIEKFSPRDLRQIWKTLAGCIRIDLEIRNRVQGHAFDDIGSQAYDRYDYLHEKREAIETWATFLDTLLADANNVVPFAREARA